jgi:protein arginine kinase activator
MVCDICGKYEATVHLTEIIDGKTTELHLCEKCAREKGTQMEQHFGITDLLAGLADLGSKLDIEEDVDVKCENCGMSYSDFKKIGRFGCSECYSAFKKYLPSLLKRIHGSSKYVGSFPKTREFKEKKDELEKLREKLQRAIDKEEFEEAAKIRDRIRGIEAKRKRNG